MRAWLQYWQYMWMIYITCGTNKDMLNKSKLKLSKKLGLPIWVKICWVQGIQIKGK